MSTWTEIDQLEIQSRLSVSDTSFFFDEPIVVDLPSGTYRVSIRVISPGGHDYVAAVRVALPSPDLRRGRQLGEVSVGFAQIGLCDRDAAEHALEALKGDEIFTYYDQLQTETLFGAIHLPGMKMPYVRAGYGGDASPVYELQGANGAIAGTEVDCVNGIDHSH